MRVAFQTDPNLKNILCKNKDKLIPNSYPCSVRVCSCGLLYNVETKKKIISRSIEHQQESIKGNWSSSGATEMSGNAQRIARAKSTGYTPKLSPWKIDIMIEKWGNHWKLIWRYSGMDKIKCWAATMGTLLRQMRENLGSKKWKHYIEFDVILY